MDDTHRIYLGDNFQRFFVRWLNYLLTIVMFISLIASMPNKKLWFTKFGTRTMNVYLLHMAVPLLLSACLFSEFIDKKCGLFYLCLTNKP